jgi:hypothetical protein
VTRLERRCRLLLRAYPAAYRHERGEEIIGTLLETTPAGRNWPPLRDARALAIGGLRARAALSQQRTTAASLREAVLVGVTAAVCLRFPSSLAALAHAERVQGTAQLYWTSAWLGYFVPAVLAVTALLAWVSHRRPEVLACAIPASAVVVYAAHLRGLTVGESVTDLGCLAALVLAGGSRERPSLRWLWPLGMLAVIGLLPELSNALVWRALFGVGILALFAASLAWLFVDARPAIAVAVWVLAIWLPVAIDDLRFGFSPVVGLPLLITAMLGAGAFWRLRRQSAGRDRRIG